MKQKYDRKAIIDLANRFIANGDGLTKTAKKLNAAGYRTQRGVKFSYGRLYNLLYKSGAATTDASKRVTNVNTPSSSADVLDLTELVLASQISDDRKISMIGNLYSKV